MPPKGNAWQHTIFVVGLLQLPFLQHWNWLERRHWHLPFPVVPVAHEGKRRHIPSTPAEASKGKNWDTGTYGKHQTKNLKFLVHQ